MFRGGEMSKLAQNFAKYLIHAKMTAKGVVEKPDIIGAIFGQTEGLLGADLDLREMQRTGRIGRIEVNVKTTKGASTAEIAIPSSLDASETALIAASLETIEKVGPCDAKIEVDRVEDVRSHKRQYLVERAKEILRETMDEGLPDSQRITDMIKQAVMSWEVSTYKGLSCGPDIENFDEIIVVEGRADVINLLKNGIRNVIAIEGSKIPDVIVDMTKEKIITAFLDGDRGGDLDLKKLLAVAEIDFVTRAEPGMEVEDLTKKQIYKALREKIPADQISAKKIAKTEVRERKTRKEDSTEVNSLFKKLMDEIGGTRAVYILNERNEILRKIPLSELSVIANDFSTIGSIVFDGKINQDIVDLAIQKKTRYLVGTDYRERVKSSPTLRILTLRDL